MSKKYPQIPGKGKFLLSEPFLSDPNFQRTVVLLTEHNNEEGSFGFILNRPVKMKLSEIVPEFPSFGAPVFVGGPVQQNSLHFLHRIPELVEDSEEVLPGVWWGGNFEKLKYLMQIRDISPDDIRFFIGYSGWGPNQLKDEMEKRSWIIAPGEEQFTFASNHEELWQQILRSMGLRYQMMSNYPLDPSLN